MRYQKYIDRFPLLEGKNILITGSNTGLGFEFARLVLSKKAHLFMAVRNLDKGNNAIKMLKEEFKDAKITLLKLDQVDKESINEFVNKVKETHLDYFVFNAGVYIPRNDIKSKEGYNYTLATNFIGPVRITEGLLDYFREHNTSLIFVNSCARSKVKLMHQINKRIYYKKENHKIYSESKHYLMDYSIILARDNKDLRIINVAPGISGTNILKNNDSKFGKFFAKIGTKVMNIIGNNPEKAGLIILDATLESRVSLDYIVPRGLFHTGGYPKKIKTPFSGVTHFEGLEELI